MTELPIVRKCSWCGKLMDRESARLVCHFWEGIPYLISHTVCSECDKEHFPEDEQVAPTLKSEKLMVCPDIPNPEKEK